MDLLLDRFDIGKTGGQSSQSFAASVKDCTQPFQSRRIPNPISTSTCTLGYLATITVGATVHPNPRSVIVIPVTRPSSTFAEARDAGPGACAIDLLCHRQAHPSR